jgi:hypothetical protein
MRTPKAVMLDAMLRFESIGLSLLAKAERLAETEASASQIAMLATEGHKFMIAAVQCADQVAPYVHARLIAMQGDEKDKDKPSFVVRAPAVMADSSAWQAAVGAAIIEREAVRSGGQPAAFVADQKSSRISTMMPARPVVVKPTGSQEWLESVAAGQRRASKPLERLRGNALNVAPARCRHHRRRIIGASAAVPPRSFFHWGNLGMAALYFIECSAFAHLEP